MNFISRLDVNSLDSTQILKKSVEHEMKVKSTGLKDASLKSVSRVITMQIFILPAITHIDMNCWRTDGQTNEGIDKLNPYKYRNLL